jgi:F-type H+-transporting ATPase subunit gamma
VVSVGDKGRSQLTRTEGKTFALAVGDTYKIRVTFPQVRFVQGLDLRCI